MLATSEYPAGVRFLRWLTLTALGFVAGIAAAAVVLKNALQSRGDAQSDEIALVAAFGGLPVGAKRADAAFES